MSETTPMIKLRREWIESKANTHLIVKNKEELCRSIMLAAVKHCQEMGFTVSVGRAAFKRCVITDGTLKFYHADKQS